MASFLLVTVPMITGKVFFSFFHGNHCQGNKFFQHNHAAYQSNLLHPGKIGIKKVKTAQKILSQGVSSTPLLRIQTLTMGSKHSKECFFVCVWERSGLVYYHLSYIWVDLICLTYVTSFNLHNGQFGHFVLSTSSKEV